MISVLIKPAKKFGIDPEKIRQITSGILEKQNLGQGAEVSVTFVTPSKMQKLNQKYRNLDKPTTVLTFSLQNEKGRAPRVPGDVLRLGDIVICPKIAKEQNLTIPFLLEHGIQSLLSQIPAAKNLGT
jgi:rRNA maturation RNase YbeY